MGVELYQTYTIPGSDDQGRGIASGISLLEKNFSLLLEVAATEAFHLRLSGR